MFSPFRARRQDEPRSGGKVLRERRRAVPASPYARPENSPQPTATENRNPRWFSGVFTGAGRLLSSVFRSDSGDSSSFSSSGAEDEDEKADNTGTEEFNEVDETGRTCKTCTMLGERQLTAQSERKLAIEKLLLQESFSRDESDRLIKIIESRVVDAIEIGKLAGQKDLPDRTVHTDVTFLGTQGSLNWRRKFPEGLPYSSNYLNDLSPGSSILHTYSYDLCDKAIFEAKKWLEDKKTETTSKSGLDCGPSTLDTDAIQYHVEDEAGSPVDLAKSYMRARPPWQSPILSNIGFKSPPIGMILKDDSPYARGDSCSASKSLKRSYLATDFDDTRNVRLKSMENPPDSTLFQHGESSFRTLEHKACQTVDEQNLGVVCSNPDSNPLSVIEASNRMEASSGMRKLADTSASKAAKFSAEDGYTEVRSHDEKTSDVNHSTNDEVDTENDKIHGTCILNSASSIPDTEDNFNGENVNNEISTHTELPPGAESGLESLSAGCDCPDLGQTGAGKDSSVGTDPTDFIITDTNKDMAEAPQLDKLVSNVSVLDESASLEPSVNHNDARNSVKSLNLESEEHASMHVKSPSSSKCNSDQPVNNSEVHTSDAHVVPAATRIIQDHRLPQAELLPAPEVKDTPVDMRPPDGDGRAEKAISANGDFPLQPGSSSNPFVSSLKKKKGNGDTADTVQAAAPQPSSGAPADAPAGLGTTHVPAEPHNGTTVKSIERMIPENSPNSRYGRGMRRVVGKPTRRGRGRGSARS